MDRLKKDFNLKNLGSCKKLSCQYFYMVALFSQTLPFKIRHLVKLLFTEKKGRTKGYLHKPLILLYNPKSRAMNKRKKAIKMLNGTVIIMS